MKSIEKLDFVELEDQLSEDFLSQKGGFFAIVEEDNPKKFIDLWSWNLSHEELKIINIELTVKKLLFTGRIFPPRDFTHILLTAYIASRSLLITVILEHNKIFRLRMTKYLLKTIVDISVFECFDLRL